VKEKKCFFVRCAAVILLCTPVRFVHILWILTPKVHAFAKKTDGSRRICAAIAKNL